MATYRIHRLKSHLREPFRCASHVGGTASVKPRDYEPGPAPELIAHSVPTETIDAATPYAAYVALRDTATPLHPGDLLESENGSLRIYKYVGFEQAQWVFPEPKVNASAAQETLETVAGAQSS